MTEEVFVEDGAMVEKGTPLLRLGNPTVMLGDMNQETAIIEQINNQLLKLVDVVNTVDMTMDDHIERELLLMKIKIQKCWINLVISRMLPYSQISI